jgi:hypothetical protein
MKTYIVMYFDTLESCHQIYKIVEEDHDKAMLEAYKRYDKSWKSPDSLNMEIMKDFYTNSEVVAIVDAPMNMVELTYHQLVYEMPNTGDDEIENV